jgi:5-dehydro-2-deoxygluconokinase
LQTAVRPDHDGRVSVDLYPEQIGSAWPTCETLRQVASAAARRTSPSAARASACAPRSSPRSATIRSAPTCRDALRGFGVDPRWVGTHPTLRTPVVFCEIFPPDDFPLLFYREPTAHRT